MRVYTADTFLREFLDPLFDGDHLNIRLDLCGAELVGGPRDTAELWLRQRDAIKVYPTRRNGYVAFIPSQLSPPGAPPPSLAIGTGIGERWGLWPVFGDYSAADLSMLADKFQCDLTQPIPVPGNVWSLLRSTPIKHQPQALARALKVAWRSTTDASSASVEDGEQLELPFV